MIAHVLIEYPEAEALADHLTRTRGACFNSRWQPYGARPNTREAGRRALPDGPFIAVNGSGHFHHETYAVMESVARRNPCVYLHIDAHPDKDTFYRWKLDCASFVGAVVEIPEVRAGVLLGLHVSTDLQDLPGLVFAQELNYYRCDLFAKLRQYAVRSTGIREVYSRYTRRDGVQARRNPAVVGARVERIPAGWSIQRGLVVGWKDLSAFDPRSLTVPEVYISVDLDVLRRGVVTDWRRGGGISDGGDNQGDMELPELRALLQQIARHCRVLGADICGLTHEISRLDEATRNRSLETAAVVYDELIAALEKRQPEIDIPRP